MNKTDLPISFYHAKTSGKSRGGLILCPEIFGVHPDIRKLADQYASSGFEVIAPAFFDRVEKDVELDYKTGMQKGMEIVGKLGWERPVADVGLCARYFTEKLGQKSVGVLGYCWGGSLAWFAACRLPKGRLQAAVCYYGSQIYNNRDEKPTCPGIFHFGEKDGHIKAEQVQALRVAHPELTVYTYDAGHGFASESKADYNAAAARLSAERSGQFMIKAL